MSSKHSGLETAITLCLSLMIIVTIIGNILVCLSVVLVRKLRSPSNYLLVSLAISDLCVAILVMPLALNLEVKGYWDLGPTLCDMWVSFDVTSCTASILNLCMISVDRYLTITKPLTYGVKRTTKRMTAFIAIVWVSSCLISVPPLLVLGNEHGTDEEPSCQVSQHIVYQLYATLGAFYIPLGVMIILYYKIYGAAKSVVDAELRSLGHTTERLVNTQTNNNNLVNQHHPSAVHSQSTVYHQQHSYASRYFPAIKPLLKSTIIASNKHENCSKTQFPSSVNYDIQPLESLHDDQYQTENKITENSMFFSSPHHQPQSQQKYSPQSRPLGATDNFNETNFGETKSSSSPLQTAATQVTLTKSTPRNGLISCKDSSATTLSDVLLKETLPKNSANISHNNNNNNNNDNLNSNISSENSFHSSLLSSYKRVKESMLSSHRSQSASSSPSSTHHSLQSKYHCIIQQTQGSPVNSTTNSHNNNNNNNTFCSNFGGVRKSLGDRLSFHAAMSSGTEKRRTSSMLKERKASITLGVIMTAFTACWLPFFILALLRPFSVTVNQIPHWISSLCYWLGLTNSMLNPIIYVTFHHDFRKAFRYLLCLQCSTMDFRLRERAYQSQYGINNSSDNHLHHLTSYQYYTHPGHHPPPPPASHNLHTSSQLSCSPINQPQLPPLASQSNPISTSCSTPSSPPATTACNLNRSGCSEEKKTLSLKENLIPVNYSSKATLEPLTSSSVDEILISQQEHLLSKHTPL